MGLSRIVICMFFSFVALSGATAEPLSKPRAKPVLVISGAIQNTNNGNVAEFDREMLEAVGMQKIQTTSPWYDKRTNFEGVSLDKLMTLVGAQGTKITAIALNDYTTGLPISDFKEFNVILALKRDGHYMPVRDKGPLFIIYPYDSDPQLQSQTYYTRSAWQVAKIIVE